MTTKKVRNNDGTVDTYPDPTLAQLLYILWPWGRSADWVMESITIRAQGKGVFIVLKRSVYDTGETEVAFVGASGLEKGLDAVEGALRIEELKWKKDKFAGGNGSA